MMLRKVLLSTAVVSLAVIGLNGSAFSADKPFYKGKRITFIGNYPAGGANSTEGRIFANHLARHIPGKPRIIFRDMGGAGGLVATNFLAEAARPNGMTVGFFTWNPIAQVLSDPGLRITYPEFEFVAAAAPPVIAYIRKDVAPGINTVQDFLKAKGFKFGGLRATATHDLKGRLSLDLLIGAENYSTVTGYRGFTPIFAAIHQNEVQYHTTSIPGYRRVVEPTMEKPGLVKVLFQYETPTADGRYIRNANLPDLPTWLEVYKMKNGKDAMPSGMKWEALKFLNTLNAQLFRMVFLPPKSPKAARDALRQAFAAVVTDKKFLASYRKAIKANPSVIVGADGEKIIHSTLKNVDPKLRSFFKAYVKSGTK
jgi:tripartite-type tricarboxylate transporter receptor subunit TctC